MYRTHARSALFSSLKRWHSNPKRPLFPTRKYYNNYSCSSSNRARKNGVGIVVEIGNQKILNKLNFHYFNSHHWSALRPAIQSHWEVGMMKRQRYYVTLTTEEIRLVLQCLIRLKNRLIREGRYTDCVDELIAKIAVEWPSIPTHYNKEPYNRLFFFGVGGFFRALT